MDNENRPRFIKTLMVGTKDKKKTPSQGYAFHHPCCVCGKNAPFGIGVNLLDAMANKNVGSLGKWYCGEHRRE